MGEGGEGKEGGGSREREEEGRERGREGGREGGREEEGREIRAGQKRQ